MKSPQPEGAPPLEISIEELEALVEQARAALSEEGYKKLLGAIHTLRYVTELLEKKEASLTDLRELLCPATTEKTEKVLQQAGIDSGPEKPSGAGAEPRHAKRKARGHGRNGAAAYTGAQKVPVPHACLKAGRRVSRWMWRQSLSATRARCAGADQGTAALGGDGLRVGKVALQLVRQCVHSRRSS